MRWYLLSPDDYSGYTGKRLLAGPPARPDLPPATYFAITGDSSTEKGPPRTADWIVAPAAKAEEDPDSKTKTDPVPVAVAGMDEWTAPEFWRLVLGQHPRYTVDLAGYAAAWNIAPEIFLSALSLRSDYRTRDEWASMGRLDEDTRSLARRYDFPFALLRLYDRIPADERAAWRGLWEARNVKKNLVREMITDYYDLPAEDRRAVLAEALNFSENWKARSGSFPGDTLRDLVRARRYPRLEENRARIALLRKEMGLPPKTRLHLPPDLEATHLRLEFEFDSAESLESQLAYFTADRKARLQEILDLL